MVKHSSTMPSLAALLGLVAVAGYQNRDKIGDWVKGLSGGAGGDAAGASDGGLGGLLGKAAAAATAVTGGAAATGGLGGLLDSFRSSGLGEKADSWVGTGENHPVSPAEVEKGVGGDIIDQLAAQTGLSRDDLLKRLAAVLPDVIDKMTPAGKLPG